MSLDLDTANSKIIEDDDTGDRTVHMVVHLVAQGAPVTDVMLEIRYPQASNTVALRVVPAEQTDELDDYEHAIEIILVEEGWGKIRYSDGHVVSGRVAYLPHYSAVPFTGWEWVDFTTPRAVDATKEKPIRLDATDRRAADLSRIGEMGDDSLFSWAYDRWGEGRPGILLCDDGSGEIADFLHLAPFDDVIAQAIKNLAYAEPEAIAAKPRALSANGRVWNEDNPGLDASSFADELLGRGRKIRRRVVVLHPHTLRGKYEIDTGGATPSLRGRHAQLSTLLLEAEATCRSVGAQFIGADQRS